MIKKFFLFAMAGGFLLIACGPSQTEKTFVEPPLDEITSTDPSREIEAIPSATASPQFGIGSTRMVEKDGMVQVYVPAGEFLMGSKDNDPLAFLQDEKPQRKIYLDAFWIDQTEVTNKQYQLCVASGQCTSLERKFSGYIDSYHNNSDFADFPVMYVDWYQANDYCEWAGRRLPTEAEWEKASRGTDGFIYPWGDNPPDPSMLNYNQDFNDGSTTRVGSYPAGASPFGALDMSGNVSEWVADWYDEEFYQTAPGRNPQGPSLGEKRVIRGGSFSSAEWILRCAGRSSQGPDEYYRGVGFRCASST